MEFAEGNILSNSKTDSKEEIFDTLFSGKNITIERIISSGQTSPASGWYDQKKNEWVLLLEGEAKIEFENKLIKNLKKGDYLMIPANYRHKVTYTSIDPPCLWLAVFFD